MASNLTCDRNAQEPMSVPHLLVIEGNTPETMAEHVSFRGVPASQGYAALLRELLPGAAVDICYPADPAAALPPGAALAGCDGIAITGSALHIYSGEPAVTRQIDLVRAALTTGTPLFGSCWGLQLITVAAGGQVRRNPKGREIGLGRGIRLTDDGRRHPMYAGKVEVFNAPTFHLDEVETLPPGATVLATNGMSAVQAIELHTNGSTAWAVQYHPEYPLRELATITRRTGHHLVEEGFFADDADLGRFADDLDQLDQNPGCKRLSWRYGISNNVLDKKLRVSEVANWIEFQVLPQRAKRGRG